MLALICEFVKFASLLVKTMLILMQFDWYIFLVFMSELYVHHVQSDR